MSLSSEMPQHFSQPVFSSAGSAVKFKQSERDAIERETQEFLSKKGKITHCESGRNMIVDPVVEPDFKVPDSRKKPFEPIQSPITLVPYKNRATHKSKHGQNIRCNKDETIFWVQVGAVELGRGENLTKSEAIEIRDKFRSASGLPPVDY